MTYPLVALGDVIVGTTGTTNPTKAPLSKFTYIDVASVDNEQKRIVGAREILGSEAPSRARKLTRCNDVLVSTVRPNLNAVAIIPPSLDGAVASTGFAVLRATTAVLPEFLFYFTRSQVFIASLCKLTAGALYPAVTDRQVLEQRLALPSLLEQRRIVDILSRAESIVRLRREAQKKAAELIPALFLDCFGDPAINPKGWSIELLPDVLICPFKNGLYLPKEKYALDTSHDGVEMVHMSDAFYGEVKRGKLRRVIADEKQIRDYGLTNDDLLVARRSLTFDGAAKLCGIPVSEEPLLFESSFIRLSPDLSKVQTEYLLYYLNNDRTREAHVLSRITGITISGINQAELSKIPVMVPALSEQANFVARVNEVRSIQTQQSTATTQAEATFNALLAQIFAPA